MEATIDMPGGVRSEDASATFQNVRSQYIAQMARSYRLATDRYDF